MSIILDALILIIIAVTVFISYKRGFIKTAVSAFAFFIAIAVTAVFAQPFADFLSESSLAQTVERETEQKLITIIDENAFELNDLFEGKSEEFNRLVKIAAISEETVDEWKNGFNESREKAIKQVARRISYPMIEMFSSVLSVIIIYFASQATLSVCGFVLDKIAKLPVLRTCNKLLGVVLGIILGVFRVFLFCFIAGILIRFDQFMGGGFISNFDIEQTVFFRLISDINIFSFFI